MVSADWKKAVFQTERIECLTDKFWRGRIFLVADCFEMANMLYGRIPQRNIGPY